MVSGVLAEDDPAAPEGVTQLLEDFEIAYETENGDLLRAIVTDDYFFSEDFYSPGGTTPDFSAGGPVDVVADFGETLKSVERSGDLIVSGEGPWIVAVAESWTPDQFNRTDGTAIYVMVDDEGTMKIDNYYFAGVRVDVQADFD